MIKYIIKRIFLMALTLFIIMAILIPLILLMPVEGYAWHPESPEVFIEVCIYYVKAIFLQFNFGTMPGTYRSIAEWLTGPIRYTLYITIPAILISFPLGTFFGSLAALYKNKWPDQVINIVIILLVSVPEFVSCMLIQYFIGFKLNLFPLIFGYGDDFFSWKLFKTAIMPIICLTLGPTASFMRFVRGELSETLTADYMLLARVKGLSKPKVLLRHAFRNSLMPILPLFQSSIIAIFTGSFFVERVFSVPGIGRTFITSMLSGWQGTFLCLSMFYTILALVTGLITDICYGLIDPRIRVGSKKVIEE